MTAPSRPVLRYFGGKWRLAPWIISHFPAHRIYCEPFGGGGSVLMRKAPAYGEVYNDLDQRVINVFRVLQDAAAAAELERKLRVTPFARDEMELSYERSTDPIEDARRTIIASFMGFGSDSVTRHGRTGFRSNANRSGTTPANDWRRWPDQISAFTGRLRFVIIENRDALEVMDSQDGPDTLHYVDPPYVQDTRTDGSHGYRFEMDDQSHERLIEFLDQLEGMVVLSGYPHPIYEALVQRGWMRIESNAKVFGNRPRVEGLWLNPAVVAASSQIGLFDEVRS
jgi:DNA adenine methylase